MSEITSARTGMVTARPLGPRGLPPEHSWAGSSLAFRNPDGSWGSATNLLGASGPDGDAQTLATIGQAEGTTIVTGLNTVRVIRYDSGLPFAMAHYSRVESEPPHAGKFRSADRYLPDGSSSAPDGGWWEIDEPELWPSMFGATGRKLSPIDDAAAVQLTFDIAVALGRPVIFDRKYRCDSDINVSKPNGTVYLEGRGAGTGLDFSYGAGQFTIAGEATQIDDLSANVGKRDRSIQFASPQGLVNGDLIGVYNPTAGSFISARPYYKAGEFMEVYKAVGNSVYIYGGAFDAYDKSAVDVYKISPVTVYMSALELIESATAGPVCRVTYGKGCRATNVNGFSDFSTFIEFDRCYDTTVTAPSVRNGGASGDKYGIVMANSQGFTIQGGSLTAWLHGVALGGNTVEMSIPTRDGNIIGVSLENFDDGNGAGDAHGNCDRIRYSHCTMRNGFNFGGSNISLYDCDIEGIASLSGCCISGTEIAGGILSIKDCRLRSSGNLEPRGLIYVSPTDNMREDLMVLVSGIEVDAPNSTANGTIVRALGRNINKKMNIVIDGVTLKTNSLLAVLWASDDSGTYPGDYLVVDNIRGVCTGGARSLIHPDASIANVPTREMTQRGTVLATTNSSGPITTPAGVAFKWAYSRMPQVSPPAATRADGAAASTLGGKVAVAYIYSYDRQTIRPALQTVDGSNFTSSQAIALHWSAGVFEAA